MLIYGSIYGVTILEQDNDNKTYALISSWLEEYKISNDNKKKSKLKALIVAKMLPIIRKIAKRIARRSYDPIEDMVQAGAIGLLKSIEAYSKEVNDNFRIYAGYAIIGEMRHYLRDKLDAIRVPAHVQELMYRINDFTNSLTLDELQELTSDEVAEALKIPVKSVDFIKQVERRKSVVPLDDLFKSSDKNDNMSYEEYISSNESQELNDSKFILTETINRLPDDCRKIVEMYYYESMYQKEIAEKLNLSEMSVSRKMKKAFSLMYKMLADSEWNSNKQLEHRE